MATTKKDISLVVDTETPGNTENGSSTSDTAGDRKRAKALHFDRFFTQKGISPYDAIEWDTRDAVITDEKGDTIFEQKNVEVPKSWSQMATNIVASKYFHGSLDTGERENSARQLVGRVREL